MNLSRRQITIVVEVALLLIAAFSGAGIVANLFEVQGDSGRLFLAGALFTISTLGSIRVWMDPDRIRAAQSDAMLTIASHALEVVSRKGISGDGAQEICRLFLPATQAMAIAITDKEQILGYEGRDYELNKPGSPLRTKATLSVLADGKPRVLRSAEEIGFSSASDAKAAIIAPLLVGGKTEGTLKFYYSSVRHLNETQESIAYGFAELLSTQASAHALEEQRKLASSMELRALQSQINPHFLFNTLNTISSLIRTEPDQARTLLREFATFYRRTLENSEDLITLERELEQTERYLSLEIARFGESRLAFCAHVDPCVEGCKIPSFVIQPIVENAVRHGMPSEGTLHITCSATCQGSDILLRIEDDGIGIAASGLPDVSANDSAGGQEAMPAGQKGLGMALHNIQERIVGYFGPESYLKIESEDGAGVRVTMLLKDACVAEGKQD